MPVNEGDDKISHTESKELGSVTVRTESKPAVADLHKAIKQGNTQKVKDVLESCQLVVDSPNDHNESPLLMAANRGYVDIVHELLAHGADPFTVNASGKGLIAHICYSGKLDIMKAICSHYPRMWQMCEQNAVLPVHWAVDGRNLELLNWMLYHGADVDELDEAKSWTPLFRLAVYGGSPDVGRLLIRHGAKVNACDKHGCTVLMAATLSGFNDLVECLIDVGADIKTKSKYGKSAIDFARVFDRYDIYKILLEASQG